MNADTIARKLANTNPWAYDESTSRQNMPQHECKFCFWRKDINQYGSHAPDCLWLQAKTYANAPRSSQDPAESPIESRVSELLGETDFSHLHSLEMRLEREREFLTHAKSPTETRARQVWISQTEKEIKCEREFLGLDSGPEMTDDELLAELMK